MAAAKGDNTTPSSMENTPISDLREQLPAVRDKVPARVWLVSTVYFLERAAFYGAIAPFQNYLQNPPNNPVLPGALGLGQSRAMTIIYIWLLLSYVAPLAGGLVADIWLGRKRTIQVGFGLYALGLSVLTGTAFSQEIHHTGGLPVFIVAMILIAFGAGLVKPNLTVFMIEQYVEKEPQVITLKNGESALTSTDATVQFIYNVNYWMINLGGLASILTAVTEKFKGFGFAFLVPLCLVVISVTTFQFGSSNYETSPPTGSILPTAFKALIREKVRGKDTATNGSPASSLGSAAMNQDQMMAEIKAALRACLVFIPFPALSLSFDLMSSGLVAQAGQMQTHGLPNDIMFNLNPITVMVLLPLVQGWLYPILSRKGIRFTPYHRIAVGLFCAAAAMGYTAGVQALIYQSGPCYDHPLQCNGVGSGANDINVALQAPTYVLLALSEIFALVAGTELAYTRAPPSMKSIVQAVFILVGALSAIAGVGVSFAAKDPNMVIVYGSITALLVFVTISFSLVVFLRRRST